MIARNESLRMNRRFGQSRLNLPEELPDERSQKDLEMRSRFEAALGLLDEDLRPVLQLTSLGLSTDEIGRQLGIPPGTVKSRMHRARNRLREKARDWFF